VLFFGSYGVLLLALKEPLTRELWGQLTAKLKK
jgi:hypothetical protein